MISDYITYVGLYIYLIYSYIFLPVARKRTAIPNQCMVENFIVAESTSESKGCPLDRPIAMDII